MTGIVEYMAVDATATRVRKTPILTAGDLGMFKDEDMRHFLHTRTYPSENEGRFIILFFARSATAMSR